MQEKKNHHLEELSDSEYKITDDDPKIAGWKIEDELGVRVGKVKDMLFDKEDEKVRYVITNLEDSEFTSDKEKVLIPIGLARLNKDDKKVVVPGITETILGTLPEYRGAGSLTGEDEYAVRNSFTGKADETDTTVYDRKKFYDHDDFSIQKFYRR